MQKKTNGQTCHNMKLQLVLLSACVSLGMAQNVQPSSTVNIQPNAQSPALPPPPPPENPLSGVLRGIGMGAQKAIRGGVTRFQPTTRQIQQKQGGYKI